MSDGAPLIENDWLRVQRLLRQQRERLARLTREAARGAACAAEIEATRHHLEGLQELAEAVHARLALARDALAGLHFHRHDYSVLVVDDHEPTRYGISRALRASGYNTFEASAGAEALELSRFASALVLDVQLPDLHGFEVCRLVRHESRTQDLPIIHVSAVHKSHADRETSRTMGADDFMTTPIEFARLTSRLDRLLLERAARAC